MPTADNDIYNIPRCFFVLPVIQLKKSRATV